MICTEVDNWLQERMMGSTVWVVKLNDETIVYQDDDRNYPGDSAWLRLKQYCEQNQKYIISMYLKFRSHVEHLPDNKEGYSFIKSLRGFYSSELQYHFYNCGYLHDDGSFIFEKWKVPELLMDLKEARNLDDYRHVFIQKP